MEKSSEQIPSVFARTSAAFLAAWTKMRLLSKRGTKSTRGWDDGSQTTFLQREKEEADDYRYFPDPDLVPVVVDDAWLERVRAQLPELPLARERRYIEKLGLNCPAGHAVCQRALSLLADLHGIDEAPFRFTESSAK
jgi:Asp-tRNA(Asn)/Glu-tRNA(Gln) amidotransferase B subunit